MAEDDLVAAFLRELALDVAAGDPEGVGFLHTAAFIGWADASASSAPALRGRLFGTLALTWGEGLRLPHTCPCGESRRRYFRKRHDGRLRRWCTFCTTERGERRGMVGK